jgi:hypothetical protein
LSDARVRLHAKVSTSFSTHAKNHAHRSNKRKINAQNVFVGE